MRRSQSLSRALMRFLSRWRLWEYAPAMLRHMPEQRDSGVSQYQYLEEKPFIEDDLHLQVTEKASLATSSLR